LIAFFLISLVITVTIYEYWRGIRARHQRHGENYFSALLELTRRNRRRYGGYIIHLSMAMMAIGITGIELFQTETQGSLALGESIALNEYTITYESLAVFDADDGRNVARAVVQVDKDGTSVGELYPRRDFYFDAQQSMTIPGVRSTLDDDLYIILVDWQPISTQNATFKIYHNPLVNWLWLGAWVFVLGTLVAAWPDKDPEPARARASQRKFSPSAAD
jgi:cytochrome c-type biogenesis protein CcmF